jgi:hypothetical protein
MRLIVSLVIAVICMAGCIAAPFPGPSQTGSSPPIPTPQPVDGGSYQTGPPVEEAPYPQGASDTGFNASKFAEGHTSRLQSANSYTLEFRNSKLTYDGWRTATSLDLRVNIEANEVTGKRDQLYGERRRRDDIYVSDRTSFRKNLSGNSPKYGLLQGTYTSNQLTNKSIELAVYVTLARFNFTATQTMHRDGNVLIKYESTGIDGAKWADTPASNSTATIVIDESGIVRQLYSEAKWKSGAKIITSIKISDPGATNVGRPAWVDTAENEVTPNPRSPPNALFEAEQRTETLETSRGQISVTVVEFVLAGGDAVDPSSLEISVQSEGEVLTGYDLKSLQVPNGQLESASPFPDSDELEDGDKIRVVHVVPPDHQNSIRIDPDKGTVIAGGGEISNGGLRESHEVRLLWTHGQRTATVAEYEIE